MPLTTVDQFLVPAEKDAVIYGSKLTDPDELRRWSQKYYFNFMSTFIAILCKPPLIIG